jgi:hypothetical protein
MNRSFSRGAYRFSTLARTASSPADARDWSNRPKQYIHGDGATLAHDTRLNRRQGRVETLTEILEECWRLDNLNHILEVLVLNRSGCHSLNNPRLGLRRREHIMQCVTNLQCGDGRSPGRRPSRCDSRHEGQRLAQSSRDFVTKEWQQHRGAEVEKLHNTLGLRDDRVIAGRRDVVAAGQRKDVCEAGEKDYIRMPQRSDGTGLKVLAGRVRDEGGRRPREPKCKPSG